MDKLYPNMAKGNLNEGQIDNLYLEYAKEKSGTLFAFEFIYQYFGPTGFKPEFFVEDNQGHLWGQATLYEEYIRIREENAGNDIATYNEFFETYGIEHPYMLSPRSKSETGKQSTSVRVQNFQRNNPEIFNNLKISGYYLNIDNPFEEKNYEDIVRKTISEIGYDSEDLGFDFKTVEFINKIGLQSTDIAQGVDRDNNEDQGAGDQGLMFGYANNETDVLMPAPITYSHRLVHKLATLRKSKDVNWLRPDAKSQITFKYDSGKVKSVDTIVISTQHSPDISQNEIKDYINDCVIKDVIPPEYMTNKTIIHVNPTGSFEIGGPVGDCGLTGRKIIVDTYGGMARHGGGAFSGKDPSKVDRSAAYAARYLAKNIVASGVSKKCLIQLAYAIGVSKPLSIYVDLFDNDLDKNKFISEEISKNFDLSPRGIREMLGLNKPIYEKTAAYGHFGRVPEENGSFSWEKTDKKGIFSK